MAESISPSSLCCLLLLLLNLTRISRCAFSGQECLNTHNSFRDLHANTPAMKYSLELEKEAQQFADQLAEDDSKLPIPTRDLPKRRRRNVNPTTDPFFHKELWDGEILFPMSSTDLNKNRPVRIGESIHKFCCYSFPLCPSEFFHNLNFPPAAKGVVEHFYKEMKNYDFAKGSKKSNVAEDGEVRHFTNIVWQKTTQVGCAQSKRNKKGCVYSVIRYRVEGSNGAEEDFKVNVQPIGPDDKKRQSPEPENSYVVAFIIVVVLVIVIIALCGIAYFKRGKLRSYFTEYQIKRGTKKAEASLRENYDEESARRRPSIISRLSTRKTRPSIYVVPNLPPPNTVPLEAREPAPIYQNLAVMYTPEDGAVTIIDKAGEEKKKLPPRPTSPVKADSPALRPHSTVLPHGRETQQNPPSQRQSLPSPPAAPNQSSIAFPKSQATNQSSSLPSDAEKPRAKNKPLPKPYVNLDYTAKPHGVQNGVSVATSKAADECIRAPIPAPRPAKGKTSDDIPKPAPRPLKSGAKQEQFQPRQLVPGRASRASKKNPNFRTLPLNDRGSLKRPEKSKTGPDNKGKTPDSVTAQASVEAGVPKKVPMIPTKKPKPTVAEPSKKPLLPKNLGVVQEEESKPSSVAEMRRLLEQRNGK